MTGTPHDVSHDDFVEALLNYVNAALRASGEAADYCQEALRVVDARNHLFASAGIHRTDEEQASMPCAIFAHSTTKPWNGAPIEHVVPQWHVILDYKFGLSPQQSNNISPS